MVEVIGNVIYCVGDTYCLLMKNGQPCDYESAKPNIPRLEAHLQDKHGEGFSVVWVINKDITFLKSKPLGNKHVCPKCALYYSENNRSHKSSCDMQFNRGKRLADIYNRISRQYKKKFEALIASKYSFREFKSKCLTNS